MEIEVTGRGPLLQGQDKAIVDQFVRAANREVAQQAEANVHMYLDVNIQNPTPYYETQIITDTVGADFVVHDRGIVYGPWLEGVSPANARSRFKGYHSFRKARQETQGQVGKIVQAVLRRFIGRM
jgi:hypothetical protein